MSPDVKRLRSELKRLRNFPVNTTPVSRHLEIMADCLANGEDYAMFAEEPEHCAITMYAVLIDLYKRKGAAKAGEE